MEADSSNAIVDWVNGPNLNEFKCQCNIAIKISTDIDSNIDEKFYCTSILSYHIQRYMRINMSKDWYAVFQSIDVWTYSGLD